MYKALENSLYVKNKKRFEQIRAKADGFNQGFNGNNIIQDDIFHIIQNYAVRKETPLELLRYPIDDEELCACTFVRGGRLFVLLNSKLPLCKQIFAVGHELYHVWCYLENENSDLAQKGSMLNATTMDESSSEQEEMEANAFSGLLLVPADTLRQQIRIYGIVISEITVKDVLMLMEIFAVPYKAIVLRLYEEGLISECQAKALFEVKASNIQQLIKRTGKAKRWIEPLITEISFGGLDEYLAINKENDSLIPSRLECDERRLQELREKLNANTGTRR